MRMLIIIAVVLFTSMGSGLTTYAGVPPYRLKPTDTIIGEEAYNEFQHYVEVLADPGNHLTIDSVLSDRWSDRFEVRNHLLRGSRDFSRDLRHGAWFRFSVAPAHDDDFGWMLWLGRFGLYKLYRIEHGEGRFIAMTGTALPFDDESAHSVSPLLELPVHSDIATTYYVQAVAMPTASGISYIVSAEEGSQKGNRHLLIDGVFSGIMLAMAIYNLFIFISLRDRSYLYYSLYILFWCLLVAVNDSPAYHYLWPDYPMLSVRTYTPLFHLMLGFFTIFAMTFLKTREYMPRLHWMLWWIIILLLPSSIASIAGYDPGSFFVARLPFLIGTLAVVLLLTAGIVIWRKAYTPAAYFLLGYSVLAIGQMLAALDLAGIIPRIAIPFGHGVTHGVVVLASVIEVMLLAFALAYRIRFMRLQITEQVMLQEQQTRQHEEVKRQLLENEHETLEHQIAERTADLRERNDQLERSNHELAATLDQLKAAEADLVRSEKLSSIGQIANGVAFELRDPLTFLSANVRPLQRDVDDILLLIEKYSLLGDDPSDQELEEIAQLEERVDLPLVVEEIELLLKGMEEGASRTAEIVRTLRNFSRLDEGEMKLVNLHEGIDSTLVLLRGSYRDRVEIVREYGDLPEVECRPGEVNQVFMEVLSNLIEASSQGETITITTRAENGEVKVQMYGRGSATEAMVTGREIVRRHGGSIALDNGDGTTVKITLPLTQSTLVERQ